MTKQSATWFSQHLPQNAVTRLQRAAATPINGDHLARVKAIEDATFWAKLTYPNFYKQEK